MPPPVTAPRRVARLDTLTKPGLVRRAPAQPAAAAAAKKVTCCDDPQIEDEDGAKVCKNCYTQISESNIVADVTFQEDSRGAATVQGGFIGENARHARTLGSAAYRRVGGGDKNSLQEIEANGRRELAALCPRLHIPDTVSIQAASIWSLAAKQNFTAGRRTDEVISACLYAACRRQRDNAVLLMDISEHQRINVFRLGEVYKDLCRDLFLDNESHLGYQHLVELEPLILKYCRNLEFGDATRQVAEDAVKIIRRMKRDWIVTGRHPAGLCGGAIILAARMNNFRRTVREVVFVSKVADITVSKRVEEFRRTRSAALTVDQFRQYGTRLKLQADPPSLHLADLRHEKFEAKKRKRQAYNDTRDGVGNTPADDDAHTSPSATPAPTQPTGDGEASPKRRKTSHTSGASSSNQPEVRYDSDGFAIPALPVDHSQGSDASNKPKRRGRPRKEVEKPEPVPRISEEELADEQELEHEIEEVLDNPQVIDTRNDIERAKAEERARLLADQQRCVDAEKTQARRDAQGITWFADRPADLPPLAPGDVPTDADLEAEFANDPEVLNCRLSDAEAQAKEKIWVAFNEDWLRTQHEKELLAKIAESSGAGRRDHAGRGGRLGAAAASRANKKRKRRGRMGDGSLLADAPTPIETPADASAAMLAKRAPVAFSRYVNYEALSRVYGAGSRPPSEAPTTAAASTTDAASRDPTPSSVASSRAPPSATSGSARAPRGSARRTAKPAAPSPSQRAPNVSASLPRGPRAAPAAAAAAAPASPPPTQEQLADPAADPRDEEAEEEEDEDEEQADDQVDYRGGDDHDDEHDPYAAGSDREDIGEDDYHRAIDDLGGAAIGAAFGEDDDDY